MRKAGEIAVGASMRMFQPQVGGHLTVAGGVTEKIRLAGTLSKGFVRRRDGIYGEVLGGAEPLINRFLQYGVLAGVGYGDVSAHHPRCQNETEGFCFVPDGHVDQVAVRYVRYAAQGHFIVRAPKIVHAAAGFRVSLMDMRIREVNEERRHGRAHPVALEPFIVGRAGPHWGQVEVQVRYTGIVNSPRADGRKLVAPDELTFSIGLRLVLGAGEESQAARR